MPITKKQKLVLDFITAYIDTHTFSPTQEEIRQHFKLKSLGSVQRYLKYLSEQGHIRLEWNARRGISIDDQTTLSSHESTIEIPLLGKVAAGPFLEAVEDDRQVSVPMSFVKRNSKYFALKVSGQSMIEDGILDGDIIIVREQKSAHNGQTAVVQYEGGVTVKKFYQKQNAVHLAPANENMKPMIIKSGDIQILGIVSGLLRSYE